MAGPLSPARLRVRDVLRVGGAGLRTRPMRVFLSAHKIQPPISDFLRDRAWIQSRLKQEVLSLKFGVAKGDEVEMQRDVVVQTAMKKLR